MAQHTEHPFPTLRQALDFVVRELIPRRHLYIVDVYGGELQKGNQAAIQIVDEEHVFGNGQLGLTLHLAFDMRTCADYFARFQSSPLKERFVPVPYDSIPCFAVPFGTNVNAALDLSHAILATIYFNPDAMELEYEVLDLGDWDDFFAQLGEQPARSQRRSST